MFENLLTRIGIGGVTVDTRLSQASYRTEDRISGVIEVTGGDSTQTFNGIELTLYEVTRGYRKDSDFDEYQEVIQATRLDHTLTVGKGETIDIPFEFSVSGLVVSDDGHSVKLHTKVLLPGSIDANDEDDIHITG
ncbi:sporulation protein [Salinicoccus carnicancri]|uniref:sporulation protein n=1 Tax=Salinicoccus carnicancri TaxID=558170 RepID=UPI0002DAFCE3|nr:sporulation protein [Salinicoccus carnicancri]